MKYFVANYEVIDRSIDEIKQWTYKYDAAGQQQDRYLKYELGNPPKLPSAPYLKHMISISICLEFGKQVTSLANL